MQLAIPPQAWAPYNPNEMVIRVLPWDAELDEANASSSFTVVVEGDQEASVSQLRAAIDATYASLPSDTVERVYSLIILRDRNALSLDMLEVKLRDPPYLLRSCDEVILDPRG